MAIEHIVFDLGNVLIDWNPRYLYKPNFETEEELNYFLNEVCPQSWNVQMDGGRPFAEAIAERQALFPKYSEQIDWWYSRWPEMIGGEIPATVAILKRLVKRGTSLFALTNWSAETFPFARAQFPFLMEFKHIVVSGEVGYIKPQAEIFNLAASTWGLDPSTLLFIDDSLTNAEGAIAAGWSAIQYTTAKQLEVDLKGLKLL